MGLPGHRRTSSHKRRRASHFALTKPALTTDKAGRAHLMHRAAPNATEFDGKQIHVKGLERKMRKLLDKTKPQTHEEHDHKDHDHSEKKAATKKA